MPYCASRTTYRLSRSEARRRLYSGGSAPKIGIPYRNRIRDSLVSVMLRHSITAAAHKQERHRRWERGHSCIKEPGHRSYCRNKRRYLYSKIKSHGGTVGNPVTYTREGSTG